LLLDVASGAGRRAAGARPARASPRLVGSRAASEEGLKEIGERVRVSEHLAHLVFGHRAEAAALGAAAAVVDVPAAALARIESLPAGGAGLLVLPPVGAELVVFLALVGVAEDFVRFGDALERVLR